jgi:hypothetical protein
MPTTTPATPVVLPRGTCVSQVTDILSYVYFKFSVERIFLRRKSLILKNLKVAWILVASQNTNRHLTATDNLTDNLADNLTDNLADNLTDNLAERWDPLNLPLWRRSREWTRQ